MSTEERREALRERLITAAEETIAANGLAALKARPLAEAVGCAVGAIYTAFPDLDALILACNGRSLSALDAWLAQTAPASGDPGERLIQLAVRYLAFATSHPRRWRAMFEHRLPDDYPVPDWYGEALAAVFSQLEEPLTALLPDLPADQRSPIAQGLFASVHGMVIIGLDGKLGRVDPAALETQIRTLVGATLAGLCAEFGADAPAPG